MKEFNIFQHLIDRHCDFTSDKSVIPDPVNNVVTFLIWNLSGELVGYQRYNPLTEDKKTNNPKEARYFTRVRKGRYAPYGLEQYTQDEPLYIVEGVFDLFSMRKAGATNVLAVLGSKPPNNFFDFLKSHQNEIIRVVDGTGDDKVKRLNFGEDRAIMCPDGEDANSLPTEKLKEMINAIK